MLPAGMLSQGRQDMDLRWPGLGPSAEEQGDIVAFRRGIVPLHAERASPLVFREDGTISLGDSGAWAGEESGGAANNGDASFTLVSRCKVEVRNFQ